ncbi:MAG: HDOD domain-containing protein [Verrucomicrobia bacterium]|nr:HDOD domain-containing protein [Verrucomicrobiota bacterium]
MIAGTALSPEDIVREVRHLPSAPKVLPRLKQLLSDGNSAMHEIVALVRLDPGIAARVLQLANSAYFSKGTRCFTVDEAVNRVGYEQVYELVAYAVASQVLVRPLTVYSIEADDLWRMSVSCALAAEALAERTNQDRDVAYTTGLLHCVGMVAIDEWALRQARPVVLKNNGFPREAIESERAELGFTQAETGCTLLKHWGFPPSISEPVRWQYTPRATASQARMATLLFAAKWVRSAVCTPEGGTPPALPEANQLSALGIGPSVLSALAVEITARLAHLNTLLDAPAGDVVDRSRFPGQNWDI